ncbi:MAG TPA: DUF1223 domain-containing protein [Stellaceae bacterium]|nr:DUF1223 domain-containing protein [Stellaceae bacterium]
MLLRRFAPASFIGFLLIASCGGALAQPKALLELFTSQGCSSCPPADKLMGEFAEDPSVVALSLPIDIWDYLGWKDTLALPGHTARQRAYALMRGDRQVYTPQIVVNGITHVVGSDRDAVERAIAQSGRDAAVMSLPVLVATAGGDLTITVAAKAGENAAGEVWLCPLASVIAVAIGRGENRGHTVTYHNVVRAWRKLGDWRGAEATWTVPIAQINTGNIDAAAVLVQEGTRERPGPVLGAAIAAFAPRRPALASSPGN